MYFQMRSTCATAKCIIDVSRALMKYFSMILLIQYSIDNSIMLIKAFVILLMLK